MDNNCEWCRGSNEDAQSPETLCRAHLAEYEGLSIDELNRRDREEAWDLL